MRPARLLGSLLGAALLSAVAAAAAPRAPLAGQALDALRTLPVLHNGRTKPFDSFARETIRLITGASRVDGQDPVATVLAIAADPSAWTDAPLLSVPFRPLRQELGMDPRARSVSYDDLVSTKRLMRQLPAIVAKQQRDEKLTMLDQESMDLYDRFVAFTMTMRQEFTLVPPAPGGGPAWQPVLKSPIAPAWKALVAAAGRGDSAAFAAAAREVRRQARAANPAAWPPDWRLQLEVAYHRIAPFAVARALYALAVLLLGAGLSPKRRRLRQLGFAACLLGAGWHVAGIAIRVIVGGRPPVSNFYETLLWLPFVGIVVAIVLERIYRSGVLAMAGSALAGIALALADVVPLDSSISPVVAVLRSNLWLTVHVLTIVASYGALALATILAHVYGWFFLRKAGRRSLLNALDVYLYRALQVGVVLLAGGIMLGAVWANASWGRYWGWDPKETWALITLLWFLAVLHGRFAGWLHGIRVALATIAGFFLLLMTYYGVSFYLVGLHSYAGGHARPLPLLLILYLVAEVAFLCILGSAAWARRRPA